MNQLACLQDQCWKSNNWSGTKLREEDNITKQNSTQPLNRVGVTHCNGVSDTIFLANFVQLLLTIAIICCSLYCLGMLHHQSDIRQFVFLAESLLIVEEPKTRFHNHPQSQSPPQGTSHEGSANWLWPLLKYRTGGHLT